MGHGRQRSLVSMLSDSAATDKPPARMAPVPAEAGPAAGNPLESETARRMLEIAERLFAENGVELVPLRHIVVEAGQRNRSALHYHFGSREALVSQLLNFRLTHINKVRNRYLDEVEAAGLGGDVRAIVEASINALADTIRDTPWGASYVQVLAQAAFSPSLLNADMINADAMSGVMRARKMIAAALPDLPREILHNRQKWFTCSVVCSLAQWCHQNQVSARRGQPPVADLADYCTAALTAPVGKPGMATRGARGSTE
ncbi:TetR family transcriptional regulator [Burkholderiaceae bacterium 16]|nr:TetR family transcriptional regulator [Burkholderiaceae bacterium 16]